MACIAFGCSNRLSKKIPNITFHSFPKNETLRKEWIKAVRRKNWSPSIHSKICSEHFKEPDFDRTYLFKVYLKSGAVPTVFKAFPKNVQKSAQEYNRKYIDQRKSGSMFPRSRKTIQSSKNKNAQIKTKLSKTLIHEAKIDDKIKVKTEVPAPKNDEYTPKKPRLILPMPGSPSTSKELPPPINFAVFSGGGQVFKLPVLSLQKNMLNPASSQSSTTRSDEKRQSLVVTCMSSSDLKSSSTAEKDSHLKKNVYVLNSIEFLPKSPLTSNSSNSTSVTQECKNASVVSTNSTPTKSLLLIPQTPTFSQSSSKSILLLPSQNSKGVSSNLVSQKTKGPSALGALLILQGPPQSTPIFRSTPAQTQNLGLAAGNMVITPTLNDTNNQGNSSLIKTAKKGASMKRMEFDKRQGKIASLKQKIMNYQRALFKYMALDKLITNRIDQNDQVLVQLKFAIQALKNSKTRFAFLSDED